MSRLMSDLNKLNVHRKADGGITVSEAKEDKDVVVRQKPEYQGIYFLCFLLVLLIGFSVLSLSISFKTIAQFDAMSSEFKEVLAELSGQQQEFEKLKSLVAESADEKIVQINSMANKIGALESSVNLSEKELTRLKSGYTDLKEETEMAIKKLQASDRLMQDKYTFLDKELKKFNEESFLFLNKY